MYFSLQAENDNFVKVHPIISFVYETLNNWSCSENCYIYIFSQDHEFKYDLHDTSIQCQPSRPVSGKQLVQLVADVLTNSAYVSLHLGDASTALMFAKYVLSMKEVSPMHKLV